MTGKMAKSRRAISPILATLLLVVIAVAAIVVTYAWVMTYMTNVGKQAGVIMYKANVDFYNVSGVKKIDVDMGNSGTSDTQIIGLYVGTSSATLKNQNYDSVATSCRQDADNYRQLQLDGWRDILLQSSLLFGTNSR